MSKPESTISHTRTSRPPPLLVPPVCYIALMDGLCPGGNGDGTASNPNPNKYQLGSTVVGSMGMVKFWVNLGGGFGSESSL